jgi:hypothetical protein
VEKWNHVLERQRPRPSQFDFATRYAFAVRDQLERAEIR